jgi:hypothetical protein
MAMSKQNRRLFSVIFFSKNANSTVCGFASAEQATISPRLGKASQASVYSVVRKGAQAPQKVPMFTRGSHVQMAKARQQGTPKAGTKKAVAY